MRAYVGVTDDNWYRFLADRPGVTEVNFWQPSGAREFRVLAPGEPFFFKTHYPHNKLVGGGFFSDSARLRVSEAWEFFGEANGVASIEEMRARIGRYRRAPIGVGEDPVIGCLFVRDVRFFPADAVADPPPQFAPNIVQGKSYDMADPAVAGYFADVLQLTLGATVELDFSQPWHRPGPVFGDPRLAPYRLGQQSFKAVVLDSYHRRCAVSGTHIPPVLAGGPHPPGCQGRGAPARQRAAAQVRYPHPVRPRVPRRGPAAPPAGQPAAAGRFQQRRPSSTPRPGRSSTCRNAGRTGLAGSSWSGTSTRSSSSQPQPERRPTACYVRRRG